ncbi:hypothetical protein [Saccharothrix syringae]|uniref:hypothetical protein n=1 Tax=Saccharothrix syringae TaxID=103733 RepID=UPI000A5C6E68|nr:hypothetical protein [Saccharothrix syringae]
MHQTDTGRAVANPRRTRLGLDWTARPVGGADRPQPAPNPAPDACAEERPVG